MIVRAPCPPGALSS